MFAKVTRPIGPDETSDVVERDLAELGASLLLEVIEDLAAGRAVEEPQDDSLSTYASKVTKDEGLVDWTLPAVDIHNRVRGLYPWPHAFTYLDGERLILMRTHVASEPTTRAARARSSTPRADVFTLPPVTAGLTCHRRTPARRAAGDEDA